MAELNFSTRELKEIQRVSEKDRLRAYYNYWTRMEAFIKAIGSGISLPLQEFDVSMEPGKTAERLCVQGSALEANKWSIHDLKTFDGCAAALVIEGKGSAISHQQCTYPKD